MLTKTNSSSLLTSAGTSNANVYSLYLINRAVTRAETLTFPIKPVIYDGERSRLTPGLAPGQAQIYHALVTPPPEPGVYLLQVTLIQEFVAWFDMAPQNLFANVLIEVSD